MTVGVPSDLGTAWVPPGFQLVLKAMCMPFYPNCTWPLGLWVGLEYMGCRRLTGEGFGLCGYGEDIIRAG